MPTVIVDGQEIEIGDDERINGIEAARRVGVEIPHYCWHKGLSVVASCRMCLVETGRKDAETGEISMLPKLVPGCQTPATDGTVFVTNSEKVTNARAMVEEDLLIRHPIDCPICDKAGECHLQDYHFQHGREERRADLQPFTSRRRTLGDTVTLFVDRCVMCTRCVRFAREISGTSELMVINRGAHEEIDVFPGFPLDNKLSGNVVDLCPVGALGDKDFLYEQRVWFMKNHNGVCTGCSTGCSIVVDENQDQIYRLRPRENEHVNQWWMCDEGRYGWKYVHDENRVTQPQVRQRGEFKNIEWSEAPTALSADLNKAGKLALVLSPFLTVEEAWLLGKYVRSIDENAVVAVGPIPIEGEDESFPNGFTIRAEKCPNRKGVEAIAAHFMGELVNWDSFLKQAADNTFNGVWLTGGYPNQWCDEEAAETLGKLSLLVVQDMFAGPAWQRATWRLPGAAFAERAGSYVNHADRLQTAQWAIRPPAGVMVEGHFAWRLLEQPSLYNPRQALDELARAIPYFSAAAGLVPETGVSLLVNQLADA